jgi:hypothetical protein
MSQPDFSIIQIVLSNVDENWGNSPVHWELTVRRNGKDYLLSLWFTTLWSWCKQNRPKWAAYFRSVRNSIPGIGPKHGKMFRIFHEEEFDFLPVFIAYLGHAPENDWFEIKAPGYQQPALPSITQVTAKMREIEELFVTMKEWDSKNEVFMDNALSWLTDEAVRVFPEIINADGAHITKLHELLVKHVINLGADIESLAFSAANSTDPN